MIDLHDIVQETPDTLKKIFFDHGFCVELGQDMKNRHPDLDFDEAAEGYFAPTIRMIFLSQGDKLDMAARYNHELGHFADLNLLGNGVWPAGYFSLTPAFQSALKQDEDKLKSENYAALDTLSMQVLEKDFPDEDKVFWCGEWRKHFIDTTMKPKEIAAELFCNNQGYTANMPYPLSSLFPASNEILLGRLAPYLG